MVESLGNIIAQDDSRGDASSIAIVIDIGSSGIDPNSFPCIHATRYQFVGTPWVSSINFPPGDPVHVNVWQNNYFPEETRVKKFRVNEFNKCEPHSAKPKEKNFISCVSWKHELAMLLNVSNGRVKGYLSYPVKTCE